MGKMGSKNLRAVCVNKIRPLVRVPMQSKAGSPQKCGKKTDQESNRLDEENKNGTTKLDGEENEKLKPAGRRIMVVVDSSAAAKGALLWVLTHTVQSHDKLILLYVSKLSGKQDNDETSKKMSPKVYELLHSMSKTCLSKRPEVEVELKMVEGKEKGPTIVEEAKKQAISLLVLGQKKKSSTWRLLLMWAGSKVVGNGGGMVEYCIQNADCMALAVRRNNKKVGGYMITTKRQRDFWLLA